MLGVRKGTASAAATVAAKPPTKARAALKRNKKGESGPSLEVQAAAASGKFAVSGGGVADPQRRYLTLLVAGHSYRYIVAITGLTHTDVNKQLNLTRFC